MKKCIKCRQEIPDDCEVCTYCGQWQNQIKEESFLKTTKQCVKCKQKIPVDCEECTFCGQLQPINENEKDRGNTLNAENTEKENLKKQWKTAVVVIAVSVIVFIGIISMIMTPSTKKESSSTSYQKSTTEPIISDNSVNGKGYYHFDNTMGIAIDKYRNIVEKTEESTLANTIDNITIDSFKSDSISIFLDSEQVTSYTYNYYNGDTLICLHVNDKDEVVAASYMYTSNITSGMKYGKEAMTEQLISKPAKWLYALSDDLTYDKAWEIYKTLFSNHLNALTEAKEGKEEVIAHYYNGYTILVNASTSSESITVLKTDSDFIDKNNIKAGSESIFRPIDEETTVDSNLQENSQSSDVTYKHTAISGANIYREDGSPKFIYFEVCEKCGEQDSIERMVTAKYEGDYTDNFICENCGNNQEVVIKIERINDNVKADYETTQNGKTSDENRVSFGEYSFVLPDNWGYDESSEMLYENYNHSLGYSGMLLRIIKTQTHPDNDFYSCAYHLLGEKDGYYYVATEPNGMEFDYQDETATAKYNTAKEQIGQVLSSFEFE